MGGQFRLCVGIAEFLVIFVWPPLSMSRKNSSPPFDDVSLGSGRLMYVGVSRSNSIEVV